MQKTVNIALYVSTFCVMLATGCPAFAREWPEGEESASHDYVGSRSIIISEESDRTEERPLDMGLVFEDSAMLGKERHKWSLKQSSEQDASRGKAGEKAVVDEVWGF